MIIISEEEKNRIRGLHKNYSIIKEGVGDVLGIPEDSLHPNVLKFINEKSTATHVQIMKMLAGCYEGTGHYLEALTPNGTQCTGNSPSLCEHLDKKGFVIYTDNNGKAYELNVCKMGDYKFEGPAGGGPYKPLVTEYVNTGMDTILNYDDAESDFKDVPLKWAEVSKGKYNLKKI